MSGSAHVSELAVQLGSGQRWAMIRTHFGIQSFGVNAYMADEPGMTIVGEDDELGEGSGGHEELYFVSSGRATFTVNGDEIDAPVGTFVFVRDLAAKRMAVAEEAGTTIVIAGGKPGEAFTPSTWERNAPALTHFATGEYDKAIEEFERLLAETPDDPRVLYNYGCALSLSGKTKDAIANLKRALELDPDFAELAAKDSDFDPIRNDPEFPSPVAGKADSGSSGS